MNAPAIIRPIAKTGADELQSAAAERPIAAPPRLTSRAIFQGTRLVVIEHEGTEYRLQITGRGKLILTR